MSLRFISRTAVPFLVALAIAAPARAQSTDPHHDDQQTQGAPQLPGGVMGGGMMGNSSGGMAGMMQMMQMMQSSQMMQIAQMMQMMQMMQSLQGPDDRAGLGGGMAMDGTPMMGDAASAPLGNVEAVIAYYKTTIGITDSQATPWGAFADAVRAAARQLQQVRQAGNAPVTALDQLARKSAIFEAEIAAIRQIEPSARALYAVLSPTQQRTADLLMADHLSRM
jgi:hypothetical protein